LIDGNWLEPEYLAKEIGLKLSHHLLKHFKTLFAVLDERIPLGVTPQSDAISEIIEGGKMVNPDFTAAKRAANRFCAKCRKAKENT